MALIVLVVVIPLVIWLCKRRKREQISVAGKQQHHLSKAHLIRYDKRQCRQSVICAIVFLILTVVVCLMVYLDVVPIFSDVLMVIVFALYFCSGPALFYSVYQLISGFSYLRRLQKHGYEIPENKKDYDSLLELLPHQADETMGQGAKEPCNKESLVLGICALCALFLLFGIDIWFFFEWYDFYENEIVFLIGLMSLIDVVLSIYCVTFFRQMNEKRYKDDVELDADRKNRMPLVEGVLTIFILLVLSGVGKHTAHSMTNYVFRSRVSTDIAMVQSIQRSLVTAYVIFENQSKDALWEKRKEELINGVDITTWGVPEDEFQMEVANMLGISDFSQLKEEFYNADGEAVVYVQIEGHTLKVELKNPIDKAKELDSSFYIEYTIQ